VWTVEAECKKKWIGVLDKKPLSSMKLNATGDLLAVGFVTGAKKVY